MNADNKNWYLQSPDVLRSKLCDCKKTEVALGWDAYAAFIFSTRGLVLDSLLGK